MDKKGDFKLNTKINGQPAELEQNRDNIVEFRS